MRPDRRVGRRVCFAEPSERRAARVLSSLGFNYDFAADRSTLSAGNVATLPNKVAGAVDFLTVTGTVAAGTPDATFRGAVSLSVASAKAQSNLAALTFAFLQGSADFELFHVFSGLQDTARVHVGTQASATPSERGLTLYTTSTLGVARAGNGVDTIYSQSAAAAVTAPTCLNLSSSVAGGAVLRKGSTVLFTEPFAAAPSALAPDGTLTLWALPGGGLPFSGKWVRTLIAPRVFTASERATAQTALHLLYGV